MSNKQESSKELAQSDDLIDPQSDSGYLSGNISGVIHSSTNLDSGYVESFSNLSLGNARNNLDVPIETPVIVNQSPVDGYNYIVHSDIPPWQILYQQDDDGETQLHIAALKGCEASMRTLITVCPSPLLLNVCNDFGHTALHLAVVAGHAVIVRMLVIAGAKVECRDNAGETPMHVASALGDSACLRALLAPLPSQSLGHHAAALEVKSYKGDACVHLAVKGRHKEALRTLVWYGANINSRECLGGRTPLHLAVENGHLEMVKYILENFKKYLLLGTENYGGKTARQLAKRTESRNLFALVPLAKDEDYDDDGTSETGSSGDDLSWCSGISCESSMSGLRPQVSTS